MQNQANNVTFDESKLSLSDQQKYNDAQSTLKTIANWRQQQIDQINNAANSQNEPLYNKTAAEKNQLNDLNNQIAQTKQEIANLQNQLNDLNNKSSQSGTATKPSTNTPVDKPATKPVVTPSDHNSGHSTSSATPSKDNQQLQLTNRQLSQVIIKAITLLIHHQVLQRQARTQLAHQLSQAQQVISQLLNQAIAKANPLLVVKRIQVSRPQVQ